MSMNNDERIILVTGANRGIGFFLVKKLSKEYSQTNTIILLGCRDLKRGEDALIKLNNPSNVKILQIDLSSFESIQLAVKKIKEDYFKLDIVVHNAAISTNEITVNQARNLFNTNYYGVKKLNEYLIPIMKEYGRILHVSSRVASNILEECSLSIQKKYLSDTLTINELDNLIEEFILSIETNNIDKIGYNSKSNYLLYGLTKVALNCLTRIEARQSSKEKNILFISVTPGLCDTDMTKGMLNTRSPQLGADSIFFIIDTPFHHIDNGSFYRDGIKIPFINNSNVFH